MTPPLPPPRRHEQAGPPPPMPHYLQMMMRDMQQKQPKWQQNQQMEPPVPEQRGRGSGRYGGRGSGRGSGRYGGRYGGRGRGRGGSPRQKNRKNPRDDQVQSNRKRGPSDDVRDASRFFLPSFLGDPWNELEAGKDREQQAAEEIKNYGELQSRTDMYQTRHGVVNDGLGRVLFQPSFLEDPWVRVYNY